MKINSNLLILFIIILILALIIFTASTGLTNAAVKMSVIVMIFNLMVLIPAFINNVFDVDLGGDVDDNIITTINPELIVENMQNTKEDNMFDIERYGLKHKYTSAKNTQYAPINYAKSAKRFGEIAGFDKDNQSFWDYR